MMTKPSEMDVDRGAKSEIGLDEMDNQVGWGIKHLYGANKIWGKKWNMYWNDETYMSRYHEKREKNNVAVKKFRKDKSVKDLGKMKQLELVRMVMIWKMVYLASKVLSPKFRLHSPTFNASTVKTPLKHS